MTKADIVEAVYQKLESYSKKESAELAPAWDAVIARLDRIDSELERTGEEDEMRWSLEGETLCCISIGVDGHLAGRIGMDGVQQTLSTQRALEVFLDWVLSHYLELVEDGEEEGLRSVELLPHPSEPLLSPEEIAAFQE